MHFASVVRQVHSYILVVVLYVYTLCDGHSQSFFFLQHCTVELSIEVRLKLQYRYILLFSIFTMT
jgi:hypothetical protein